MIGENNHNYNRVEYDCHGCGKRILIIPSRVKLKKHNFCDKECYKKNMGKYSKGKNNIQDNTQVFICDHCGNEFKRVPNQNKGKKKYCSRDCYYEVIQNKPKTQLIALNCPVCASGFEVWKSKLSYTKDNYCSRKCANIGFGIKYSRENSPCYNSNITDEERERQRHTPKNNNWRNAIYERDNYTCQCCGDNKGGNLRAHHILNYSEYLELRYEMENGIVFCESCHVRFHNIYGYKNNNKEQLNEYLNDYCAKMEHSK